MSVTSETTVLSYAADGATVGPYPLTGLERSADIDIKLYVNSAPWTDFTISTDGLRTGTVLSLGTALTIYRETPKTQAQPFPPNTTPAAEDISAGLDKLTFISQDLSEQVSRGIIAPRGSAAPVGGFVKTPNTTLGQDTTGTFVSRTTAQELAHLGITDQGVLSSTVAATNTLTIYTDPNVGPMTLVIGGENVVFPSTTTYNQESAAAAIAGIINAGSFAVTATSSGAYVVVSANVSGAGGNGIACSISVGGAYGTWASAATTGGTLSGVVLSGIAQDLSLTQKEQAQRNLGIYGAPLIVQGTGIDPTGATPSSDGLNAFFTANPRGEFYIPEGFYWLDKAVKLYESANYRGAGSTPYQPNGHVAGTTEPSGTVFFAKQSAEYPFVNDADGDRTMFISDTWTKTNMYWMHNFAFTNCGIDGNKVADYGFKIYQMGEVGHITDCTITDCRKACVFATGAHAPFTMRNCTINGPGEFEVVPNTTPKTYVNTYPYTGLHFGKHPSLSGSSGEVRLIGLSGDRNNGGIIRISGGHAVTAFGSKFENNSFQTILFDAQALGGTIGKGGGAASLTLVGGYSQDPTSQYKTSEEIIRIEEGVTPSISMNGFTYTQGVNSAEYGDGVNGEGVTNDRNPPVQFYDSTGNFYTPALIRNTEPKAYVGNGSTTEFATVYSDPKVYLGSPRVLQTTGYSVSSGNVIFTTAPAQDVAIYIWSEDVITTLNSVGSVRTPFFAYGPGMNTFHSSIQLGNSKSIYGTRVSTDEMWPILSWPSDDVVTLKAYNGAGVALRDNGGVKRVLVNQVGIGFNAEAPIAKPTIIGSRASGAAMASLLTALQNYGLITDGTSA